MDEEEEDKEVVVLHPPRVKMIKTASGEHGKEPGIQSPAPRGRAVLVFIDMQAIVRVSFISLT